MHIRYALYLQVFVRNIPVGVHIFVFLYARQNIDKKPQRIVSYEYIRFARAVFQFSKCS